MSNQRNTPTFKIIGSKTKTQGVQQKIWTDDEDIILKEVTLTYQNSSKKWKKVAIHLKGKTPKQCYSRFRQVNPVFKQGVWTKSEEAKLLSLVATHGKKWAEIAEIFKTRSGKQIRHHFINVLDGSIAKYPFSNEEDILIKELYLKLGPKWKTISEQLKGRTGDTIKNRFYNKIKNCIYSNESRGKVYDLNSRK
jgi:hypothetical protein